MTLTQPRNGAYPTIVVDGRGASGKSSFGEFLRTTLPGFSVLNGDEYFEPHEDPVTWGAVNEVRFDAEVLAALRAGSRSFDVRPFNFQSGRLDEARTIEVSSGVVIERCFGFGLNVDWDLRIWVETPRDICLKRGIERDTSAELGERVRLAWETVWQPKEDDYIAATGPLELADIVVMGTQPFTERRRLPPSAPSLSQEILTLANSIALR